MGWRNRRGTVDKTTAVQIRQSMKLAQEFKLAGIRFVPVPVEDEQDYLLTVQLMEEKLDRMIADGE